MSSFKNKISLGTSRTRQNSVRYEGFQIIQYRRIFNAPFEQFNAYLPVKIRNSFAVLPFRI